MKYGLNKEKLSMMLRDNASNGIKACRDWGIKSFGCIDFRSNFYVFSTWQLFVSIVRFKIFAFSCQLY